MIVGWDELVELRGTVAMVDGGFDPLHHGHIAYFAAAARLGAPVLCNLADDEYVARKHRPLLTQNQRAVVIDAIRCIDYVHPSQTTTRNVLEQVCARYYVKGDDWRGRLPPDEQATCAGVGTEIVYVPTVVDSSTAILRRHHDA
jgi:cytidyltransferase-like protein